MSTRAQRKALNQAKSGKTGLSKKAPANPTAKKVEAAGPELTSGATSSAAEAKKVAAKAPPAKDGHERPGDRVVEAHFEAGAAQLEQFPPPAFSEIAFAGRSNVGKSSLMNCLTSRKSLVRTSSTPGCTRQVAWFRTVSDDKSVVDLVDLPGYGYAKRSKTERGHWANLIECYLLERPTLRGVVLLVDIRRGIEPDDLDLIEMLQGEARTHRAPLDLVLVATKLDKLSTAAQKTALHKVSEASGLKVIGFSSVTGQGRLQLWRRLRTIAGVTATVETTVE